MIFQDKTKPFLTDFVCGGCDTIGRLRHLVVKNILNLGF
jgi:hypothetical protein